MDDDLQHLEAELGRLRPVEPSNDLIARIERELAGGESNRRPAPVGDDRSGDRGSPAMIPVRPSARAGWWWIAAFPAAAAIAIAIWRFTPGIETPFASSSGAMAATPVAGTAGGANATLKPVRAENVLVEASDEGLVTMADGTRARRERLQFVDTIVWKNARTNASLTWSVPREEVRVVPIIFQ